LKDVGFGTFHHRLCVFNRSVLGFQQVPVRFRLVSLGLACLFVYRLFIKTVLKKHSLRYKVYLRGRRGGIG
jgi:hypothetical protein